jgi:hypothetical protein
VAAGVRIRIDGDDLELEANKEPPRAIIESLKRHKTGILALLRRAEDPGEGNEHCANAHPIGTDLDDDCFEERAPICQYEGGLPREIAGRLARLESIPPPVGFTLVDWCAVVNGAARFADQRGAQALGLGWTFWNYVDCTARRRQLGGMDADWPSSCVVGKLLHSVARPRPFERRAALCKSIDAGV